jgi:hypothetical protein
LGPLSKRTVDTIVLATSLFAGVALLGAAVTAFDASGSRGDPRALIGSSPRPASSMPEAAPLDLAQAEQALAPLVPVGADDHTGVAPMLADDGHAHDDMASAPGHGGHDPSMPDGHAHDPAAPDGHGHGGDVENAQVIADGDDWEGGPFEGQRIQWEPAGPGRGAGMRIVNEGDTVHEYSPTDEQCSGVVPTEDEEAFATSLVTRTSDEMFKYRNRPDVALADGFTPYPIGNRYWHMINFERLRTPEVLNPGALESFIYGMVDGEGLIPLGGMYMYDQKDQVPPAPFGCITSWHRHVGSQGFITSFDPSDPRSVWMVHVWDLRAIGPWGEHDGTHASDWWVGWKYIPNACLNSDCL